MEGGGGGGKPRSSLNPRLNKTFRSDSGKGALGKEKEGVRGEEGGIRKEGRLYY